MDSAKLAYRQADRPTHRERWLHVRVKKDVATADMMAG
jgi:hypothetical protein